MIELALTRGALIDGIAYNKSNMSTIEYLLGSLHNILVFPERSLSLRSSGSLQ
jgi:hypothetical protein